MWYLLVAAGAGYLAQRWQSAQKTRPLSADQNERTNLPTSPLATPRREFHSSSSHSVPNICNAVHDASSGIASMCQNLKSCGLDVLLDKDISSSPQEIKSNKRSACEAFLVNPMQVETEQHLFTSKCSLTVASNADVKEEQQLKEELSSSPSSCCSSTSTVSNSPKDSHLVFQRQDVPFQFHGKEQDFQSAWQSGFFCFQGKEQMNQSRKLQNESVNPVLSKLGESPGDAFAVVPKQCLEALQHVGTGKHKESVLDYPIVAPQNNISAVGSCHPAACTDEGMMPDANIHTPLPFTGKRQGNNIRADFLRDGHECTLSNSDAKQGTSQSVTRKSGSLLSLSRDIESERALESVANAESDAFISFGLAMAVCFMVSSGKKEMDKMGKILRETEDLVCDMRKELVQRKLRSSMGEEEDDEFFTITTKDEPRQEFATANAGKHIDTFSNNSLGKDQSIRHDATVEVVQNHAHICDVDNEHGAASYSVEDNAERSGYYIANGTDNGKLEGACDWDSEDESDSEEGGENDYVMSLIELERKLWTVFQQRQEERISELEEALESALDRLHAKEKELCWWKNRASWLMEQLDSSAGELRTGFLTENQAQRVEGFECTNEQYGVIDVSLLSSYGTSSSAVEGCIEVVGGRDSCPIPDGCLIPFGRTISTCSVSRENALSVDVGTVSCSADQCGRVLQHIQDTGRVDF